MKLLTRYNQVNILATITVLIFGGCCYYYILQKVLLGQLDDDLKVEQQEIIDYVKENNDLPQAADYKDQKISFENSLGLTPTTFKSIAIFDTTQKENILTRQLTFSIKLSGKGYKVYVSKSQEGTEELVKLIVLITLAMVILLLVVLFSINRFVLNKLWLPFNETLQELKQFNINTASLPQLKNNNITEFIELNKAVVTMSDRVITDYTALKSFTENASHEIQTPLSIINSKIELLIQGENYTKQQMNDLLTINEEATRLSKLNRSLLLLTKIDNDQFQQAARVDLNRIIDHYLDKYEELIATKKITLSKNSTGECTVMMNEVMAQVLVSNLINNAIKHNVENGFINIIIIDQKLQITNTGALLTSNPAELFERFKKARVDTESLGLGLAIVKKICTQYHFDINYNYAANKHELVVDFLSIHKS